MPLTKSKRQEKEHLYFTLGKSRKIYLGTAVRPRKDAVREALTYLDGKIRKYENERFELQKLLLLGNKGYNFHMKYKLTVFDLDGVIFDKPWLDTSSDKVAVSSWDILFQGLRIYPVHEQLKRQFEEGGFKTYTEWTDAACNVLKSLRLKERDFENILTKRPFVRGAAETLQALSSNGGRVAIVTGSFSALAQRVREIATVHDVYAHCELHFDENGILKSWKLHPTDYQDKARFVKELAKKYKVPKQYCAYVGDDVNDLDAFKQVGLSIAFNSTKQRVRQAADVVIESRNLMSILPYLNDRENDTSSAH